MINSVKKALLLSFLVGGLTQGISAQPALSPSNDIISLGTLRVDETPQGDRRIILQDETRGDVELVLTPSLVQAVDESPAESFEVEGYMSQGELVVRSLRPIE